MSGFASVLTSPTSVKLEIPAITLRMIFPERVFGMSLTTQTFFGRAIFPISVSIAFDTLSSISSLLALTPGLSATYISTAFPRTSSTTGTAAASATSSTVMLATPAPWRPSGVPATLITSSIRPRMQSNRRRIGSLRRRRSTASRAKPVVLVFAIRVVGVYEVLVVAQIVSKIPGQGLRMQMLPALPLPASTSLPSSS